MMNEALYFLSTMILLFYIHAIEASEGKLYSMFAWSWLFLIVSWFKIKTSWSVFILDLMVNGHLGQL